MNKLKATTYVICPIGTTIELYTDQQPAIGEAFNIRHIDTKKIIQKATVKSVEEISQKHFKVLATIIK